MKKKIFRRAILAIAISLVVLFVIFHYDNGEYNRDNIDEYVYRMCELYGVPGFSAAVIDGDSKYFINVGNAIDENSRFELASTTKAFTALGILKLAKENRLSITDPVSRYLTWFKPTYNGEVCDITVENLMCHTSGIPEWTITTIPEGEGSEEGLLKRTIQNIKDVKLDSIPGTQHEYATINYDVLALIIEEVTGEKYEDYVTSEILGPLGMDNSFFRISDEDQKKEVQGYKAMFLKPQKFNAPTYYGNTAAGYLVSSTSDLMKWLEVWSEGSKDNSPFVNMVDDALSYDVSDTGNYFAGWNIYDTYICHGGNNPNFSSQVIIGRGERIGVFTLSNLAGSSATMIADGIYRILLGENIKIELQLDPIAVADFISIETILLTLYLLLLFGDVKSKKACILSTLVSVILMASAMILPIVFHYPYNAMFVWLPITVCIAIGVMLAGAVILTATYLFRLHLSQS